MTLWSFARTLLLLLILLPAVMHTTRAEAINMAEQNEIEKKEVGNNTNYDTDRNGIEREISEQSYIDAFLNKVKSVEWGSHTLTSVIADVAGFLVFSIILGLIIRRHVREGLESGATILSSVFIREVIPRIDEVKKKVIETIDKPNTHIYSGIDAPEASQPIAEALSSVSALIACGAWNEAERRLTDLLNRNPTDINILIGFSELYTHPGYEGDMNGSLKLARLLEKNRSVFETSAPFYRLLAVAFNNARTVMPPMEAKIKAINAIQQAIALDPKKPLYLLTRGYISYSFGNIGEAIQISEEGLKLAENVNSLEDIERSKNNLAYYYAASHNEALRNKAIDFAQSAYNYEKRKNKVIPRELAQRAETLAYVKIQFARDEQDIGDIEDAIKLLEEAASLDPKDISYEKSLKDARNLLEYYVSMGAGTHNKHLD
jgi:tetratricopeptide (TPR) repeat protein